MTEEKKETKEEVKTQNEYVKHEFNKEEMEEMHKELAEKTSQLRRKEEEKKSIVSQFGADITKLETATLSLADKINLRYEHRMLKCEVKYNWKTGKKEIIHPETKKAIRTDPVTEEERQQKLALDDKKKEKKKVKGKEENKPAGEEE